MGPGAAAAAEGFALQRAPFRDNDGKCDGGEEGEGEHPGKADLCSLPMWGPRGRLHLLPFGIAQPSEHRACYCPQPWQKELALSLLGCWALGREWEGWGDAAGKGHTPLTRWARSNCIPLALGSSPCVVG